MESISKKIERNKKQIEYGKKLEKEVHLLLTDVYAIKEISKESNENDFDEILINAICNAYYLGLARGYRRKGYIDRLTTKKGEFELK